MTKVSPSLVVSDRVGYSRLAACGAGLIVLLFVVVSVPTIVRAEQGMSDHDSNQLMTEALHILGGYRNRVPRWTDTVRVAVIGVDDKETTRSIRSLLGELSILTGLNYRILRHSYTQAEQYLVAVSNSPRYDLAVCNGYTELECANFIVIIASQPTMHQIALSIPMRNIFQTATRSEEAVSYTHLTLPTICSV